MRNINDLTKDQGVTCKTEEEVIEFTKLLHQAGFKWKNGESYLDSTYWSPDMKSITYFPKRGTWTQFTTSLDKTIPVSEFFPSNPKLPEFWYLEVTDENIDKIGKWRTSGSLFKDQKGYVLSFKNEARGCWVSELSYIDTTKYFPITTEQFYRDVLGEEVFPTKWKIMRTEKNHEVINDWINKKTKMDYQFHSTYIYSEKVNNWSYQYTTPFEFGIDDFTEITFEQFKTHILKQNIMPKQTIKRGDLIELFNFDTCTTWKEVIKKYLDRTSTENDSYIITLDNNDLSRIDRECTVSQKYILDKKGISYEKSIKLPEVHGNGFIATSLDSKSFVLSNEYNWTIDGQYLIPTAK